MSGQSNGNPKQGTRQIPSELPARRDVAGVGCAGLARAIEMLASGSLNGESAVALLRHELASVQRQAEFVSDLLQRSSVELRQLRESAQRDQVERQDEQRQLQDQNDRFVANLIHDHDLEMASLRRERDAAIDRVRDLSRGITRVGATSSSTLRRAPTNAGIRPAPSLQEVAELRARVEDLLRERERSLKLLRQLAEQRDQAEARLQATMASLGSVGPPTPDRPAALSHEPSSGGSRPEKESSTSPNPSSVPTEPSAASMGSAAAVLGDPDAWDVGGGPNEGNAVMAGPRPAAPELSANSSDAARASPHGPSAPQANNGRDEHLGAYAMLGEQLSAEEVFVRPGRRGVPKAT
jgi:hypothetical protein